MTDVSHPPVPAADGLADLTVIRDDFPALARRHRSHPVAYFDGPGGTQVPRPVGEAMLDYLYHHNANTHWHYPSSAETDAMLAEARETFAALLGGTAREVVFGPNMTTLTFHVARGLGREWGPGDEVVVTDLDHHANVAPWRTLAEERGITIRSVPFHPEDGTLDWTRFAEAVTPHTRLVAVGAASNALGTVNDLPRVAALAKGVGALLFVDAVHGAAHAVFDRVALGADLIACSPYKFYGPHLGVLSGDESLLNRIRVPRLDPAPADAPERLETGTQSHEAIVGAAATVRWLASLAPEGDRPLRGKLREVMRGLHERGQVLCAAMWEGLRECPGVRLYGPPPHADRTPTVGFTVDGISSTRVAEVLAERGLFVSHGDFYAATVVERLGLGDDGLVRVGAACYTTREEVERLIAGVEALTRE